MNKAVDESTSGCNKKTEKVDKLIYDAQVFMEKFENSFESNTAKANEIFSGLGFSLKIEMAKFQEVRTGLQNDHEKFQSSITSQFSKLHEDLAMENKIMDAFALKTEKVKVLTIKLDNAEKQTLAKTTPLVKPKVKIEPEPKGKEKLFSYEPIIDDSEEEELDEEELKRRKAREAELDEHQRIQSKASDSPNQYLLEPFVLFELQNTQYLQLDLPITPTAFEFRSFIKVGNVQSIENSADQLLLAFYLKHMRPQNETWSARKITIVKVTGPIEKESFPNAKFKVVRGFASQVHEFTLADLPCINPYNWIMLYNLLMPEEQKNEPVLSHLKLMIISYIQEVELWMSR
ncbi:unnamed protein product [Lactuca saligna]|uniref:Uncharacterized protein n=1 Tax=Lactuca saligna TaxID=75948 RepID=A0AA35YZF5_LACSI|nr:unnamed protein product [Lactuca saligna]